MKANIPYEKREELLSRAFDHLVETGLEKVTARSLGKSLKQGSYTLLYQYFADKDDCLIDATRYGLDKVSKELFSFALQNIADLDHFFATALDEVKKYQPQQRAIHQVLLCPTYGEKIRAMDADFQKMYAKEMQKLAEVLDCDASIIPPIIYSLISIILGYVLWDNRALAEYLMQELHGITVERLAEEKAKKKEIKA